MTPANSPRWNLLGGLLLAAVGAVLGAALTWALIQLLTSYRVPGSLALALGLDAALIVGGAAVVWLRLPRLKPAAVGLLLGAFVYVAVVAWIVVTSVMAFERMG